MQIVTNMLVAKRKEGKESLSLSAHPTYIIQNIFLEVLRVQILDGGELVTASGGQTS